MDVLGLLFYSILCKAESMDSPAYLPPPAKVDKMHFKECLIEFIQYTYIERFEREYYSFIIPYRYSVSE